MLEGWRTGHHALRETGVLPLTAHAVDADLRGG
jgi:hypothetical protein